MDVFDRVKTPEPAGVLGAHRNCALDTLRNRCGAGAGPTIRFRPWLGERAA